jgi:hypothetical protein
VTDDQCGRHPHACSRMLQVLLMQVADLPTIPFSNHPVRSSRMVSSMPLCSTSAVCGLVLLVALSTLGTADATHFRGGLMYWESVGPISPADNVTVRVTQRFGYQRNYSHFTFCNDTTIMQKILTGDLEYLVWQNNFTWVFGSSQVSNVECYIQSISYPTIQFCS